MRFLLVLMMVVLLMGCESLKTKNYSPPQYISLKKQDLDSFIGKNVLEAQKVFGYAYISHDLSGNRKVYTWGLGSKVGLTEITTGKTPMAQCNWSFVINESEIILESQRAGLCPSKIRYY